MKTRKVTVGEKAPVTDSIKKARDEGRPTVLVLLPNPMQCGGCDTIVAATEEAAKKHTAIAFVTLGGEDIRGAMNEETIIAKRLFGFVTMGEAMVYYIDGQGILKKITMGRFNGAVLEEILDELKWVNK